MSWSSSLQWPSARSAPPRSFSSARPTSRKVPPPLPSLRPVRKSSPGKGSRSTSRHQLRQISPLLQEGLLALHLWNRKERRMEDQGMRLRYGTFGQFRQSQNWWRLQPQNMIHSSTPIIILSFYQLCTNETINSGEPLARATKATGTSNSKKPPPSQRRKSARGRPRNLRSSSCSKGFFKNCPRESTSGKWLPLNKKEIFLDWKHISPGTVSQGKSMPPLNCLFPAIFFHTWQPLSKEIWPFNCLKSVLSWILKRKLHCSRNVRPLLAIISRKSRLRALGNSGEDKVNF